jgi:uncharacterized Zn finger protein
MKEEEKKETIKEVKTQNTVQCEVCGSIYLRKNKARHMKTTKCKQAKYIWLDRFEVKR